MGKRHVDQNWSVILGRMSEQVNHQGTAGRSSLQRKGRVAAMGRTLGVSLAQAAAAAVIVWGALKVTSVVAAYSDSPPGPGGGIPAMLAIVLLAPVGAMIIGALVAEMLQLAAGAAYSLSVVAVILIAVLGVWIPSLRSVPLLLLVLTAANLLIGYSTGMHRRWSPPPGTSSSAS
jgi:hypothetical protein